MGNPLPVPVLVGARFKNAAVTLPAGLLMQMEAAVGDEHSPWSVLSAKRGESVIVLAARSLDAEGSEYEISDALELGIPCDGLVIEARTCDLDEHPDPSAFALMDEVYACGGHGESTPLLAWQLREGRMVGVEPGRVTCGSVSCEVDR